MRIDARFLVRLYPRKWRERYGGELIDLAGARVTWSVAMNIAESGIRERLHADGYSPIRFAALAARLIVVYLVFVLGTIGLKLADFYLRFPGRSLTRGMIGLIVRSPEVSSTGGMWLIFALFATVLAVLVNGFGWRERRPRLATWLVRAGVFAALLLLVIALEWPRRFHSSRYNYYMEIYILIAALAVGYVVESARLGRQLDVVAK